MKPIKALLKNFNMGGRYDVVTAEPQVAEMFQTFKDQVKPEFSVLLFTLKEPYAESINFFVKIHTEVVNRQKTAPRLILLTSLSTENEFVIQAANMGFESLVE